MNDLVLGLLLGVAIAFFVVTLLRRKSGSDDISSLLDQKLDQKIPLISSSLRDQLKGEKEIIDRMVRNVLEELKSTSKQRSDEQKETVSSFTALRELMGRHEKLTEQLSVTTDGLRKVLSNNQLRGQFGEQVADDLLKMSGFVKGVDYEKNKSQKDSATRPDFTILLPDGVKINVDVKFPYDNLTRASETDNEDQKREFIKLFKQDVREKVKQCSTRNYINPEDNTVDFVILFIPNEMIFSFIYENLHEVWQEGMRQKVVFAGPFSFTAILRLIRQSYDTFRYQKNVRKIIVDIKNFYNEFQKYNEEFLKIGERINSLSQQYDKVNTTRTKQLLRTVDRIQLEDTETPLLDPTVEVEEGSK